MPAIDNVVSAMLEDWRSAGQPDELTRQYSYGDLVFEAEVEPHFPEDADFATQWTITIYAGERDGGDPNTDRVNRDDVLHREIIGPGSMTPPEDGI